MSTEIYQEITDILDLLNKLQSNDRKLTSCEHYFEPYRQPNLC